MGLMLDHPLTGIPCWAGTLSDLEGPGFDWWSHGGRVEKREGKTKEKKNNGRFVYPSGMFDLFIWSVNGQYYVTLPSNAGIG